jgi:hypothetical protein
MAEKSKRTYTVPVLLVLMVVLSILLVLIYSKLLLSQQTHTTDQGQRLAQRYAYAALFADQLHDGTDRLLNAKSEAERLRAMKQIGLATVASGEATGIFIEAAHLTSGLSREEAAKPIMLAMNAIIGVDSTILKLGEHDSPFTADELADLTLIRDGLVQVEEELNRFRPPSGEAGFRQMVTIGDWITPALEATKSLDKIASDLQK